MLDALDRAGVAATFFVQGMNVERYPDLVVETQSRGHLIGVHCFEHRSHFSQTTAEIEQDLGRILAALEQLGIERPGLWRPPYGEIRSPESYDVARCRGLHLLRWTVDAENWRDTSAREMMAETKRESRPDAVLESDSVVLMHDTRGPHTLALLPRLVAEVRRRGWSFAQPTHSTVTPEYQHAEGRSEPLRSGENLRFGALRRGVGRALDRAGPPYW